MEALYVILGAVLALGGGVLTHHIQLHYAQIKEDDGLLFNIEKSLLEIGGIESELEEISIDSKNLIEQARNHSLRYERMSHIENLHLSAIRLTSKKNLKIAVRVTKYALDEHLRTDDNRYLLLKQVQEALNPKLLSQYLKEVEDDPNGF